MANPEHLAILKDDVETWNRWRKDHPLVRPDLQKANLKEAQLQEADLQRANLTGANLQKANLQKANLKKTDLYRAILTEAKLQGAYLTGAYLKGAHLEKADLQGATLKEALLKGATLTGANLEKANLERADLPDADLSDATLNGANLEGAVLMKTHLNRADLTGCRVYGIAAWDLDLEETKQEALIVSPAGEPTVTVDDIEVAQFIYFMLNNEKVRRMIDSITSKAVLILGRFTKERKAVLDALRDELRKRDYLPIIFDFEKPTDRDFTETIKTLAGLCLFVIADITNPKSSPLELQATVPDYKIPFVPIIQEGEDPFSMFKDLKDKYDWVLEPVGYSSIDVLLEVFEPLILDRMWEVHQRLQTEKAEKVKTLSAAEYLKAQKKAKQLAE